MTDPRRIRAAYLALVTVQVLFSSNAIVGRLVLATVPAGLLVACRVTGAALTLVALNLARGGPWIRDRRTLAHVALSGLLGVTGNQTLFVFGLSHTTAVNATILTTTAPVFTVLGALLLGQERPSPLKLWGIGIAAAGAIYLVGPDRLSFAPGVALGNLLILLAMLCYAGYFLLSKPLLRQLDALTASTYIMVFALVGTLPLAVPAVRGADLGAIRATTWGLVGFIVLFPTIIAYLLNLWALRRVSAQTVASFIYLQPLLTATVAPLLLPAEGLSARTLVAGLGIFGGLAMVIRAERPESRPSLAGAGAPDEGRTVSISGSGRRHPDRGAT